MARRIAQAERAGELVKGRGEVSIGGERVRLAYTPAWLQEGRERRALEGRVVSGIRAQSRRSRSSRAETAPASGASPSERNSR